MSNETHGLPIASDLRQHACQPLTQRGVHDDVHRRDHLWDSRAVDQAGKDEILQNAVFARPVPADARAECRRRSERIVTFGTRRTISGAASISWSWPLSGNKRAILPTTGASERDAKFLSHLGGIKLGIQEPVQLHPAVDRCEIFLAGRCRRRSPFLTMNSETLMKKSVIGASTFFDQPPGAVDEPGLIIVKNETVQRVDDDRRSAPASQLGGRGRRPSTSECGRCDSGPALIRR